MLSTSSFSFHIQESQSIPDKLYPKLFSRHTQTGCRMYGRLSLRSRRTRGPFLKNASLDYRLVLFMEFKSHTLEISSSAHGFNHHFRQAHCMCMVDRMILCMFTSAGCYTVFLRYSKLCSANSLCTTVPFTWKASVFGDSHYRTPLLSCYNRVVSDIVPNKKWCIYSK